MPLWTLFVTATVHISWTGTTTDEIQTLLDRSPTRLTEASLDTRTEIATGSPFDALVDAVQGHDAIVIGEKAPSLKPLLFGEELDRLAATVVCSVLVVRSDEPIKN